MAGTAEKDVVKKATTKSSAPKEAQSKADTVSREEYNRLLKMIEQMQKTPAQADIMDEVDPIRDRVQVVSYMIGQNGFMLGVGREVLFPHYGSVINMTVAEVNEAIRRVQVRQLFDNGLLGFVDSKYFTYFGLESVFPLSDENLIELLSQDDEVVEKRIKELTQNMRNESVIHAMIFRIAWLLKNNKATGIGTSKQALLDKVFFSKLPDYIDMNLSKAMGYLDWME